MKLGAATKDQQQFLDYYAEAMVALHLMEQDWELQYEVPTANGRSADLKVSKGSSVFFVHIKRVNLDTATTKAWRVASSDWSVTPTHFTLHLQAEIARAGPSPEGARQ